MSLLTESYEPCIMYDKTTAPDGRGGIIASWVEGASFNAGIAINDTVEARIAQAQGAKAIYSIITTKDINLQYHDVLRRVSDGKIFRVTSDGDDNKTPPSAMLNMRVVTAEEWDFPQGGQND